MNYEFIGVRAGARTGYVVPGRDGIGGLDPAKDSSAAAVVVVVAVRGSGRGEAGGISMLSVTLASYWEPT